MDRTSFTPARLRRLARRWITFAVLGAVLGAAIAYVASKSMTPQYRAKASVVVRASSSVQTGSSFTQTANQAASTVAALITQRPIIDGVRRELRLPYTDDELSSRVAAFARSDTSLVDVTVTDTKPVRAAEIANLVASRFARNAQRDAQNRVALTANALERRIARLRAQTRGDRSAAVSSALAGLTAQYATVLTQQAQALDTVSVAALAAPATSPATPRTLLNTLIVGFLGLLVGLGAAAVRQYFDQALHTPEDVSERLELPTLASVPVFASGEGREVLLTDERAKEAYRLLRASIFFSAVGGSADTILVTSARAGEGKTRTAANLATAIAAAGQRVIVIDADMRRPQLHAAFGVELRGGLSEYLLRFSRDRADRGDSEIHEVAPNLCFLSAGTIPPNPSELLSGPYMSAFIQQLQGRFDVVVFDSPPVGAVADALGFAALAPTTVLVIDSRATKARDAARALDLLRSTGAKVAGVVLNKVKRDVANSYGYEYYGAAQPKPDGDTGDKSARTPAAAPGLRTDDPVVAPAQPVSSPMAASVPAQPPSGQSATSRSGGRARVVAARAQIRRVRGFAGRLRNAP